MVKTKSYEVKEILKTLSTKKLGAMHTFRGTEHFEDFVSVLSHIIAVDEVKMIKLVSDINDVDQAVKLASKSNFHRGRIKAIVLIHALMKNAEYELEKRELKNP